MDHLIVLLMFLSNLVTCASLLCYRRAGARYRLGVSLAAWLLIVGTGGTALRILLGRYPPGAYTCYDLGIALVLCVLSLSARGDVAAILRTRPHANP